MEYNSFSYILGIHLQMISSSIVKKNRMRKVTLHFKSKIFHWENVDQTKIRNSQNTKTKLHTFNWYFVKNGNDNKSIKICLICIDKVVVTVFNRVNVFYYIQIAITIVLIVVIGLSFSVRWLSSSH